MIESTTMLVMTAFIGGLISPALTSPILIPFNRDDLTSVKTSADSHSAIYVQDGRLCFIDFSQGTANIAIIDNGVSCASFIGESLNVFYLNNNGRLLKYSNKTKSKTTICETGEKNAEYLSCNAAETIIGMISESGSLNSKVSFAAISPFRIIKSFDVGGVVPISLYFPSDRLCVNVTGMERGPRIFSIDSFNCCEMCKITNTYFSRLFVFNNNPNLCYGIINGRNGTESWEVARLDPVYFYAKKSISPKGIPSCIAISAQSNKIAISLKQSVETENSKISIYDLSLDLKQTIELDHKSVVVCTLFSRDSKRLLIIFRNGHFIERAI